MAVSKRIAVIGAGPAGCTAAFEAARTGREVVLFEKETSVGGRTRSHRSGGHVLDTGAGFFTNFYPRLKSYNKELALENDVVRLSRQNVLIAGEITAPLALGSPLSFLRFPLIDGADKLRMIWRTIGRTLRYRRMDLANPAALAGLDTQSIAEDARRTLGEQAYQYLVRPGIEPFWYFSCEKVSQALYIGLQAKAADAVFYTYRSGMDVFCQTLANKVELRTGLGVTSIHPEKNRFRITYPGGKDVFDEVLIATTANVAEKLVSEMPDTLVTPEQKNFLQSQEYTSNVLTSFRLPSGLLPDSDTRIPCGPGENSVAAITVNSDKRSGSAEDLLTIYFRGEIAKELLRTNKKTTFDRALSLARKVDRRLENLPLQPFHLVQRERAIPVHSVGRYRTSANFLDMQKGPIVFAGDYLSTATVEGAIQTGQQAVAALGRAS